MYCRCPACSVEFFSYYIQYELIALCLPRGAVHRSESFSSRLFPSGFQVELKNRVLLPFHSQTLNILQEETTQTELLWYNSEINLSYCY